ncbi:MAG: Thiol-disulfide oxidoreductase ResA [bacterium]|nr:Thiol-disulfide oxidoreductase ResA [bacterium]
MSRPRTWILLGLGSLLLLGAGAVLGLAADTTDTEAVTLQVGDQAPAWTLEGTGKRKVSLGDYAGKKHVVLIFYPRDFTSVCTRQLCQLRDDYSQFSDLGAVGFGINDDPMESHEKFVAEQEFPFPLLVDHGLKVAASYGAAREGQSFVDRTVVIIGKDGTVLFYAKGVPSTADMVAAIKQADNAK